MGTPDLQGTWTNSSLTSVERHDMFKSKATLSDAEAAEFERTVDVPSGRYLATALRVKPVIREAACVKLVAESFTQRRG